MDPGIALVVGSALVVLGVWVASKVHVSGLLLTALGLVIGLSASFEINQNL